MEYRIIESKLKNELVQLVNEAMKDGWTLQGGVAHDSDLGYYIQAMTKKSF